MKKHSKMKILNIKTIHPLAKMPAQSTKHAFGYDVVAVSVKDITRETFEKSIAHHSPMMKLWKRIRRIFTPHPRLLKYDVGFVVQPVDKPGFLNRAIAFAPRSSVYKTGLQLTNDFGIIDVDEYTGTMSAIFRVVDDNLPHYQVGDRIGQIFLLYADKMMFVRGEIRKTERSAGGYGSTGR